MILTLFGIFLAFACFLMCFGFYSKIRVFSIVGLAIVFLLGAWIILYSSTNYNLTGLEYSTGYSISNSGSSSVISYNYAVYNDATTFWVGFLISVVACIGMFLVGVNDV